MKVPASRCLGTHKACSHSQTLLLLPSCLGTFQQLRCFRLRAAHAGLCPGGISQASPGRAAAPSPTPCLAPGAALTASAFCCSARRSLHYRRQERAAHRAGDKLLETPPGWLLLRPSLLLQVATFSCRALVSALPPGDRQLSGSLYLQGHYKLA